MFTGQQDLEWLAEIAVFQDTGVYPHGYVQKHTDLMMDYFDKFRKMGIKKAREFVFSQLESERRVKEGERK